MSEQKDYYEILEVSKNASDEAIKASYKRLSLKFHPDVNKSPDAEAIFTEINQAFFVLSDPARRREYDQGHSTSIAVSSSNLSKVAKGISIFGRGLKSAGKAYADALNDDNIQRAAGRLYRSNMYNLTGDEQYLEPEPRASKPKKRTKKKSDNNS